MRAASQEVARILATDRVLRVADHRPLERTVRRLAEQGRLVALLPGIYVAAIDRDEFPVRLLAASRWHPDAVVTGAAAARLTFWSELAVDLIRLAGVRYQGRAPSGYAFARSPLADELTLRLHGVRLTCPALTALDLGGPGIDQALLRRAATLDQMGQALAATPGRAGNRERRRLLRDSRDQPWSEAERLAHRILRAAGVTGWRTNLEVRVDGRRYYLDIALPGSRVAIEVDGFEAHSGAERFQRDRRRWTDLAAAGWRILHVTWRQLCDDPDWLLRRLAELLVRAA